MTKLVLKAHIKGYTRKDGVYVKPHDDGKAPAKAKPAPGKKVFYSKPKPAPVPYGVHHNESGKPRMVFHHPQLGETGHRVVVNNPSQPSPEPSWKAPDKVAVFVPKGIVPTPAGRSLRGGHYWLAGNPMLKRFIADQRRPGRATDGVR